MFPDYKHIEHSIKTLRNNPTKEVKKTNRIKSFMYQILKVINLERKLGGLLEFAKVVCNVAGRGRQRVPAHTVRTKPSVKAFGR